MPVFPKLLASVLITLGILAAPAWGGPTPERDNWELRVMRASPQEKRVLFRCPIRVGESFKLLYTHSLDKCPIEETFRVEPNGTLIQTEEVYGWFGAGLEFNPPQGFTYMRDGQVHIKNMKRRLSSLPVRVGWIAGFRLLINGNLVPLADLAPPGKLVEIKVTPRNSND